MIIPGVFGSRRSGSSSPYVAEAVHFDGSAWLSTPSLVSTDNGYMSVVYWQKFAADQDGRIIWVSDPENNYDLNLFTFNQHNLVFQVIDVSGGSANQIGDISDTLINTGVWQCVILSSDTNHITTAKLFKLYFGDVLDTSTPDLLGTAFNQAYNGVSFWVGADSYSDPPPDGNGLIGDIADLRIMPGVSLFDNDGNIPLATRRLFIDDTGKPVNPSVATAALGAPCILFSGDSSTFPVNRGTGGAFTLTGSLTNASSSPSD